MRPSVLAALGALVLLLAPVAASGHFCGPGGYQVVYAGAGEAGPNVAYVVIDCVMDDCFYPYFWTYHESNGLPGLQRGGATMFGDWDTCQEFPTGHDQAVF